MYPAALLIARIAIAALLAWPVAAKCTLATVAQFPIDMQTSRPLVAAALNGHVIRMLIDTGSPTSAVYRSAVQALSLELSKSDSPRRNRWGWVENAKDARVRDLDISGFVVHNLTFAVMGEGEADDPQRGILAEDFLAHWDEEFDPAAGVMRLIRPEGCNGDQVAYWAQAYSVVRLIPAWGDDLESEVQLNGHGVRASFDTGMSFTTIAAETAKRPGLHPTLESETGQPAPGIGEHKLATFASITIGQETIQNPEVYVANIPTRFSPEIRIGADFFRCHHVYVARSQQKMYFTYLGGPLFKAPATTKANAAAPVGSPPSPAQPPATTVPEAKPH